ncbi:unnamed protein product [Brachionus calyciflorus]|uniref:G-protein coupled receptors family 1 profile domain-containing protein n=1 Tax=Brachionus calyciflorus TaxID=104777 RepID=A0A814M080_9BILA|nr:unnamed protein product [Brachionus calyciflorus]
MGFYFSLNSLVNIIVTLHLFVYTFPALFQIYLSYSSDFICKIYNFLLRVLYQTSSWLNVVITADRFIFILFPNKFELKKNKKLTYLILFGIFALICLTNIPNFTLYLVTLNPNSTAPVYTNRYCTSTSDILLIRSIQTITMRTALPFILMLIKKEIEC